MSNPYQPTPPFEGDKPKDQPSAQSAPQPSAPSASQPPAGPQQPGPIGQPGPQGAQRPPQNYPYQQGPGPQGQPGRPGPQGQQWGPPPGYQQGPGQPGPQGYPGQQPYGYAAQPTKSVKDTVKQATLFLYIAAGLILGSVVLSFIGGMMISGGSYGSYGAYQGITTVAGLLQIGGWVMLFLSLWRGSQVLAKLAEKAD